MKLNRLTVTSLIIATLLFPIHTSASVISTAIIKSTLTIDSVDEQFPQYPYSDYTIGHYFAPFGECSQVNFTAGAFADCDTGYEASSGATSFVAGDSFAVTDYTIATVTGTSASAHARSDSGINLLIDNTGNQDVTVNFSLQSLQELDYFLKQNTQANPGETGSAEFTLFAFAYDPNGKNDDVGLIDLIVNNTLDQHIEYLEYGKGNPTTVCLPLGHPANFGTGFGGCSIDESFSVTVAASDSRVVFFGQGINHSAASPSAVPIPVAHWLFGSGLVGLIGVARGKKIRVRLELKANSGSKCTT